VPVAAERYFLICRRQTLDFPWVQEVLGLLRGPEFKSRVAELPGYSSERSGEIIDLEDAFPWLTRPARARVTPKRKGARVRN